MKCFEAFFQKEFDIEELICPPFSALSCEIDEVPDGSNIVIQSANYDNIDTAFLSAHHASEEDVSASATDLQSSIWLLGRMLYAGRKTNQITLCHVCTMSGKSSDLYPRHPNGLHSTLSRILTPKRTLSFKSSSNEGKFTIKVYCNAAHCKRLSDLLALSYS